MFATSFREINISHEMRHTDGFFSTHCVGCLWKQGLNTIFIVFFIITQHQGGNIMDSRIPDRGRKVVIRTRSPETRFGWVLSYLKQVFRRKEFLMLFWSNRGLLVNRTTFWNASNRICM